MVSNAPYNPELDSPEAWANFTTRHVSSLGERRRGRDELQEDVASGIRPDYFTALTAEQVTLMRAKGNVRRAMIAKHLKTASLRTIPPDWRQHDLPPPLKDALGTQHPKARGGEDLPDLCEGEVEIARLTLVNSMHGEVTSLRVWADSSINKLRLRLVDEYETEITLLRDVVESPLAPFEVLECFRDATPSPLDTSCQIRFSSYFYPALDELAQSMDIGAACVVRQPPPSARRR